MEKQDNIKNHSEELQEVLGTPPRWLVRWGTMIACFAFCALLAVAYFVEYSDTIKADLVLTAPNPPVTMMADRQGLLEAVLIKDNEEVSEGDLILVYSSAANMLDIDSLEKDLKYFSGEVYASDLEKFLPLRFLQLGTLDDEYNEFLKNYDLFTYGEVSQNDQKEINRLNREIRDIELSIRNEEGKRGDIETRKSIAAQLTARYQREYASDPQKYIGLIEQNAQKVKEIERELKELESNIENKKLKIKDINRDIETVRQQSGEVNTVLIGEIRKNINDLKGGIKIWKNENLIFAPIDGRVSFFEEFDNENQTVSEGSKILQIIPPGEAGEMYGKVDLPQLGSGDVEVGQEVVIKFDKYRTHEWGMIEGVVKSKSDVPQEDNTYKVEVELTNGLKTSIGKELNFKQGMQGTAEIVTKEKRFLYRLFDNIF